ncbi:c-type cytochrome [Undibacterium sp. SXout20W]|uniref:c-type cytochrome n=1 Tax=Undibacterium sp. SXout20W TaxID=3413051 RepID=UPI003BF3ECD0
MTDSPFDDVSHFKMPRDIPMLKSKFIFLIIMLPALTREAHAESNSIRGKELYDSRCIACHSIDQNRVGPAHQGVFNRRAGQAPGYNYSEALKNAKLVWSEKTLDAWLKSPEETIPGQAMGYSVSDAQDRADLIAYLKKFSTR